MRMKFYARTIALLSIVSMVLTLVVLPKESEAVKSPKLSKTKISLKVGKTTKIKVKKAKKVKWSLNKSAKKVISLKAKKTTATIKAKKAGNATIIAKAKYKKGKKLKTKKLKCKVTVSSDIIAGDVKKLTITSLNTYYLYRDTEDDEYGDYYAKGENFNAISAYLDDCIANHKSTGVAIGTYDTNANISLQLINITKETEEYDDPEDRTYYFNVQFKLGKYTYKVSDISINYDEDDDDDDNTGDDDGDNTGDDDRIPYATYVPVPTFNPEATVSPDTNEVFLSRVLRGADETLVYLDTDNSGDATIPVAAEDDDDFIENFGTIYLINQNLTFIHCRYDGEIRGGYTISDYSLSTESYSSDSFVHYASFNINFDYEGYKKTTHCVLKYYIV